MSYDRRIETTKPSSSDELSAIKIITNTPIGVPLVVEGGVKYDGGKPDMSLISPVAMEELAKVLTFGTKKYSRDSWRGGIKWSRYFAAILRHVFAYMKGEDKDPETGLSHLAHAMCCIMFLLEFEKTHPELDDRYKGPEVKS